MAYKWLVFYFFEPYATKIGELLVKSNHVYTFQLYIFINGEIHIKINFDDSCPFILLIIYISTFLNIHG